MKRYGHIVDRITLADLRREAAHILSSKRFRRRRAERFLENFEQEAPPLLEAIRSGTWKPHALRERDIFEHGKMRHIAIPDFEDMLTQRVLFYPRLEKIFVDHTWPHAYSSIKGRGPLKAAKHVARLIRSRKARWCLYFDVRKYYEHINPEILKRDVADILKDATAIELIGRIIDMGGNNGLAIGNTASHFLANLYLTPMAEALAGDPAVTDIVTYMDNVFVFAASKKVLHRVRLRACGLLATRGLSMKNDWQVFRTDMRPVKIGGFRVQHGKPWRIYRSTFQHLRRVLRAFARHPRVKCARSLASLRGWVLSANCNHFYNSQVKCPWREARKVIQNAN